MSSRATTQATAGFAPAQTSTQQVSGVLQRKCASCSNHTMAGGKCEECEKKGGLLKRKSNGHSEPSEVPPIVHEVLNSPGQALDAGTRAFFEPRFRHDFSNVRVHMGATAAESARAVNALAYTVGQDVVFGVGQYAPEMARGRKLLAHELAHVVQQASTRSYDSLEIADADSASEREADDAAAQALSIGQMAVQTRQHTPVQIAREDDGTTVPDAPATTSPSRVDLVRVSCESNTIEFETDAGVYVYELTECDVEDADYIATVTVEGNNVNFSPPPDAPGAHAQFPYRIEPGQPNPSTFFPGQTTVHIVTGTLSPQPSPGPGPGPGPRTSRGPLVCSRPLDFPWWTGLRNFRHAFINDPPANYAIRDLISGNGVTTSCTLKTDASGPPDDPAGAETICKPCNPGPGQTVADVSNCLRAVYSAYAQPNLYRNLPDPSDGWKHGPNSNSFAAAMARCCNNFSPAGLGRLPGWDHRPAGPCRDVPTEEESAPERDLPTEGGGTPEPSPSDAGVPLPGGVPVSPPLPVAPVGQCHVESGPTYTPSGTIPVTNVGGRKSASFSMAATFGTAYVTVPPRVPACCEVRQYIMWDRAFHAWRGGPPHSGFPSSATHGTWYEDRDTGDKRYGHRSGTHSDPIAGCGDEYRTGTTQDQANGDMYCGRDSPGGPAAMTGTFDFQLKVIDTCHGNAEKASSSIITINW